MANDHQILIVKAIRTFSEIRYTKRKFNHQRASLISPVTWFFMSCVVQVVGLNNRNNSDGILIPYAKETILVELCTVTV